MSRIDEALRRARALEPVARPEAAAGPEPFRSAWEFHDDHQPEHASRTVEPRAAEPRPVEPRVLEPRPAPPRETETTAAGPLALIEDAHPDNAGVISGFNSQWRDRLVVSPDSEPFLIEQFTRLAATLHQGQAANNLRSVMVTSASPSDGKTLTAINLALILSESYQRRVLLIDGDLRRPSIHDVSAMPNVMGLSEGLRAKTEQKLTVFRLTKNLSLLPAGRPDPDPMGGLTSSRMRRILADASSRFDWVVIDAPPVGTVADASILSEMIDGVLMVVRAGKTGYELTQKAIEAVGRDRILGVVLNAVENVSATSYEYANYYRSSGQLGPGRTD
jgi:capsular exopolysaccharide synthesis family protein